MPPVYLDSCAFILAIENIGALVEPARRLMHGLRSKPDVAVTSELTLAELLAPTRRSNAAPVADRRSLYMDLFDNGDFVRPLPIDRSILMRTVELRERFPQRLPDAIHITTALNVGCRAFVSFDRDARRLPEGLEWVVPDDVAVQRLLQELDA